MRILLGCICFIWLTLPRAWAGETIQTTIGVMHKCNDETVQPHCPEDESNEPVADIKKLEQARDESMEADWKELLEIVGNDFIRWTARIDQLQRFIRLYPEPSIYRHIAVLWIGRMQQDRKPNVYAYTEFEFKASSDDASPPSDKFIMLEHKFIHKSKAISLESAYYKELFEAARLTFQDQWLWDTFRSRPIGSSFAQYLKGQYTVLRTVGIVLLLSGLAEIGAGIGMFYKKVEYSSQFGDKVAAGISLSLIGLTSAISGSAVVGVYSIKLDKISPYTESERKKNRLQVSLDGISPYFNPENDEKGLALGFRF